MSVGYGGGSNIRKGTLGVFHERGLDFNVSAVRVGGRCLAIESGLQTRRVGNGVRVSRRRKCAWLIAHAVPIRSSEGGDGLGGSQRGHPFGVVGAVFRFGLGGKEVGGFAGVKNGQFRRLAFVSANDIVFNKNFQRA